MKIPWSVDNILILLTLSGLLGHIYHKVSMPAKILMSHRSHKSPLRHLDSGIKNLKRLVFKEVHPSIFLVWYSHTSIVFCLFLYWIFWKILMWDGQMKKTWKMWRWIWVWWMPDRKYPNDSLFVCHFWLWKSFEQFIHFFRCCFVTSLSNIFICSFQRFCITMVESLDFFGAAILVKLCTLPARKKHSKLFKTWYSFIFLLPIWNTIFENWWCEDFVRKYF